MAADGHTLAAGLSDGSVHVYNTSGHSLQQDGSASVSGKPVTAVTISGKRVIAAAADGVREMGDMSGKRPTMYKSLLPLALCCCVHADVQYGARHHRP